jgi:tRNA pseudouridine38-40 synthase
MMRIALGIEYDGAPYSGWQTQPGGGTVQDALEAALAQIAGAPVRAVCAGRTDTGVHGLAQVAHFDTAAERPETAWVKGVNTHLPRTVVVRWAARVAPDFHARFSASGRHYEYVLLNRPVRPAAWAGRAGWFHLPLDEEAMRAGARYLLGEHDFSAFRSVQCQAASPVRELRSLSIRRHGEYLRFSLAANGFLHHMVRNIVGCLVYVGKGKYPPEKMAQILAARDRALAAPTFGPEGLYLTGIDYDPHWNLPAFHAVPMFPPSQEPPS